LRNAQGAGEQRTEVYENYSDGVAQPATQRFAKNNSSATGSASGQAVVVHVY